MMMMIVMMMMIASYTNDDDSHHDDDNRHHDDDCIVHSSTIYDAANFVPDGRTNKAILGVGLPVGAPPFSSSPCPSTLATSLLCCAQSTFNLFKKTET